MSKMMILCLNDAPSLVAVIPHSTKFPRSFKNHSLTQTTDDQYGLWFGQRYIDGVSSIETPANCPILVKLGEVRELIIKLIWV